MSLNKKVFGFSLIGTIVAVTLFNSREVGLCSIYCGPAIGKYQDIFLIFPVVFLFAAVALLAKGQVFQAWWKFARIAIPVVLLISILISLKSTTGTTGWFSFEKEFNLAIISITHLVFVLGSAIQIYRGYRQG